MQTIRGQEGADRRQFRRFGLNMKVTLVIDGIGLVKSAELFDISEGGCFLRGDAKVNTDWPVSLSLSVVPGGDPCSAEGKIVRVGHGQLTGFGVMFSELSKTLREFIWAIHCVAPEDLQDILNGVDPPRIVVSRSH